MTINPITNLTNQTYWQACACCGRPIRLLGDQQSLVLFLEDETLQRRAFQCINCGNLICLECREKGGMCGCRSNAWLARPYLELFMVESM
jgi:hypothetical protein